MPELHVDLSTHDPRPIYQQIVDGIRRAIVLGTVKGGEALPSVRQLAGDLRVNPNTVQQAYRELEREGAVYARQGQGTFVTHGGLSAGERHRLIRGVAERAIRDAYRHGFTVGDLVQALSEETGATGDGGEEDADETGDAA